MKKGILFLMLMVTYSTNFAEYYPAKLIYNDGKELKGLVSYYLNLNIHDIYFKADINAKKEFISNSKLKTIIYYFEKDTAEYDILPVYRGTGQKRVTNPVWLKVLVRGTVTLYYFEIGGTMQSGSSGMMYSTDRYWYCYKNGEAAAYTVSWTFTSNVMPNKIFRKRATFYFKDCPELGKKIIDKVYKWDNIEDAVKFYNKWAESKKE